MRILYVSQYFPPEMGAPSARVSELAREWVRAGERVTVLTGFAHHPTGRKAAGDRRRLSRREDHDGLDVVRSYVWATANERVVKRMLSYLSFMVSAIVVGLLRIQRPAVVVATSPQLLCGVAGYVLARIWRVPFVLEVRDLWPESILAVAAMKENFVVRALQRVARHLYGHSDRIVTVGEGYRREIHERYGIPLDAMEVIPNGIDPGLFDPSRVGPAERGALREELAWGDRFVVMYLGTLGLAHGLETVLEAAEALRERPDVLFALVGEGADKARLRQLAVDRGLPNVAFLDQQPKERVRALYAAADVGLVSLRSSPLFRAVLPSKIFELLAMERPILVSVDGEARRVVEAAGGGLFVPPENADALARAVRRMADGEVDLEALGAAGRAHVLEHYTRPVQARRYLETLERVAGARGPA